MEALRFVVVGPGGMGQAHVQALEANAEATLIGVCEVNPEVCREFEAQGISVFQHWDDLYKLEADCAIISLPHYLYPEAVVGALDRGLHVLKEKPFAKDLADAERMAAAAGESGKILMVGGQLKFAPAFQKAKQIVAEGTLGNLFLTRDTHLYMWQAALQGQWSWRGEKQLSGGVAILDSGWHPLDMLQWLRGTPSAVYAATGTMKAAPGTEYDVDDRAVIVLDYPDGGTGVVTVCFLAHPGEARVTLHGTQATLDITPQRLTLISREGKAEDLPVPESGDPFAAQLTEFIRAIREDRPPLGNVEHALKVQRVIEAAYTSAASGQRVAL